MAQRLVDRPEEGPALAPALVVGERIGDAVEALVLPAIVARHAPNVGKIDHHPLRAWDGASVLRSSPRKRGPRISFPRQFPGLDSRLRGNERRHKPTGREMLQQSAAAQAAAGRAALAFSTIAWKAAGSRIARSESTLRSTSTPALPRPSMKRL